jgi:hypothetical protein
VVVHLFTASNAWKVHLCTLVPGHMARLAFSNPSPPSVTTTSGGAMRAMRAAHASELSLRARCQPMTWSFVQAMRMTHLRLSHIPSTCTTWWTSSQTGAIGHIDQNLAVLSRKVRAGMPISDCVFFDSIQERNSASDLASASTERVVVAPQAMHCHLLLPAAVLPWPFMLPPHTPHFRLAIHRRL